MMNLALRLLVAIGIALAPAAAFAQSKPKEPEELHTLDTSKMEDAPAVAAPQAGIPLSVNFNVTEDLDNILYLDLSTGERVGIRLMPQWAPHHVERIKELTRQGFYNGVIFHRVIDGFMAQTGDPTGTGQGGSELPDLQAEFNILPHVRGTVSMARADDDNSANSQFFIVFYPRFALDKRYTNFGRVISNMAAVDAIERGEPPADPTRILQASIASDNKPQMMPPAVQPQNVQISADMLSNSKSD